MQKMNDVATPITFTLFKMLIKYILLSYLICTKYMPKKVKMPISLEINDITRSLILYIIH